MYGLTFFVGLGLGFDWGLVIARELALLLARIEAAIEAAARF